MTEKMNISEFKALKKGKAPKFGNEKAMVNGIAFDSKKEAERYKDLLLMQKAGVIANLRRQVSYDLPVNGIVVARYEADFVYTEVKTVTIIVEDSKGYRNAVYRLKAKMFAAHYGFKIIET